MTNNTIPSKTSGCDTVLISNSDALAIIENIKLWLANGGPVKNRHLGPIWHISDIPQGNIGEFLKHSLETWPYWSGSIHRPVPSPAKGTSAAEYYSRYSGDAKLCMWNDGPYTKSINNLLSHIAEVARIQYALNTHRPVNSIDLVEEVEEKEVVPPPIRYSARENRGRFDVLNNILYVLRDGYRNSRNLRNNSYGDITPFMEDLANQVTSGLKNNSDQYVDIYMDVLWDLVFDYEEANKGSIRTSYPQEVKWYYDAILDIRSELTDNDSKGALKIDCTYNAEYLLDLLMRVRTDFEFLEGGPEKTDPIQKVICQLSKLTDSDHGTSL